MATREIFAAGLAMLGAAFGRVVDKPLLEAHWRVLGGLSDGEIEAAIDRALRACRFMPSPAELLQFVGRGGPHQLIADCALAWEAVRFARRKHGHTIGVDFGPLVNAIVRNLGGWLEFCGKNDDTMVWERKKFEELYQAFASKDHTTLNGTPLRGLFEGTERVPIAGILPPLQLAEPPNQIAGIVRELADGKAVVPNGSTPEEPTGDLLAEMAADREQRAAARRREREAQDAVAAVKLGELRARVAAGGTQS